MAAFIENLGIGKREKGYVKIVAKGTGCNPRKVKMFLNVLRIRLAIAERTGEGIEHDRSAKLFVFEYVFPEFYKSIGTEIFSVSWNDLQKEILTKNWKES
jgi:hypothetical protein